MPLPQVPDRFQALEELARGDTGVLVRARDKTLLREVVLKLPPPLDPSAPPDARDRERMLREARALARVHHPAIVRLMDVIETPAGPVLVMEPTSGESLAEKLARDGRIEATSVRAIAKQILEALEAVHAIGVVHRGIALDQILLRADGSALLTGFGFAKFSGTGASLPGTSFLYKPKPGDTRGPVLSLPPHPSPEQLEGQNADARSDLFGLGWVLYECLTGEEPYPIELDVQHWKAPKDPRGLARDIPKDLAEAVLRSLAISPMKRFASAMEMEAAIASPIVMAENAAQAIRASSRGARGSRSLLIGAGAVLVLALGYVGWQWLDHPSPALADNQQRGLSVARAPCDKSFAGQPYASLHAVVIGIDKYASWPPLSYAVADARAVEKMLIEKFGFPRENVTALVDEQATRSGIQHLLGGELKTRTKKDDGVFIFFAGHGQTEDLPNGGHMGYLVPVGGSLEEVHNQDSLIPMAEIETYARKIPAKHVFFAIDACFSGLVTGGRGLSEDDREYVGFLAREPARNVLTAGGKDQQVNETAELGHSYFTSRLLRGLADESADGDRNGVITAGEIASYIQCNVPKDTIKLKLPQMPQYSSLTNDEGQFMFLNAKAREGLK